MSRKKSTRTKPYPFQRRGIREVGKDFGLRALMAWEMGLGKTPSSLWAAEKYLPARFGERAIVIVCPKTIKWQWQNEVRKHLKWPATVLEGKAPTPLTSKSRPVYIINYDILHNSQGDSWLRRLKGINPGLVIVDEVQFIKTPGALRTKAVVELCRGVRHVLALGGTGGLETAPIELWPVIHMLRPDVFDNFWDFAHTYCGPRHNGYGWTFTGATNLKRLNRLLKATCMSRVRKKDVLKDLPDKVRTVIPVDIEDRKEYVEAETNLIKWLMKTSVRRAMRALAAERMLRIGYLKRLAARLKLKAVTDWIDEFLQSGRKLIVFGIQKSEVLHKLVGRYGGRCTLVTGDVTGKNRQAAIDRFNKDRSCRLFLGNIDAAGVGWSCSSASDVLIIEFPWSPGKLVQAEDRCHGIGRGVEGRGVNVYLMAARNTIEERLLRILQTRQGVLDQVLDGKKKGTSELNVFDLLSRSYTGERAQSPEGGSGGERRGGGGRGEGTDGSGRQSYNGDLLSVSAPKRRRPDDRLGG